MLQARLILSCIFLAILHEIKFFSNNIFLPVFKLIAQTKIQNLERKARCIIIYYSILWAGRRRWPRGFAPIGTLITRRGTVRFYQAALFWIKLRSRPFRRTKRFFDSRGGTHSVIGLIKPSLITIRVLVPKHSSPEKQLPRLFCGLSSHFWP
jgi:hypothetical protein